MSTFIATHSKKKGSEGAIAGKNNRQAAIISQSPGGGEGTPTRDIAKKIRQINRLLAIGWSGDRLLPAGIIPP
ncbi:hypothetical protein SH139x_000569 [Planctomycetaceae bacterium SH139]